MYSALSVTYVLVPCMHFDLSAMNRPTQDIQSVSYSLTSAFSSPAGLSLYTILPPLGPGQTDQHPLQNHQWLEYICRTGHPFVCWLPTKWAEWISENPREELGVPDKADQRALYATQHRFDSCRAQPYRASPSYPLNVSCTPPSWTVP
jgi:hypothetical protein